MNLRNLTICHNYLHLPLLAVYLYDNFQDVTKHFDLASLINDLLSYDRQLVRFMQVNFTPRDWENVANAFVFSDLMLDIIVGHTLAKTLETAKEENEKLFCMYQKTNARKIAQRNEYLISPISAHVLSKFTSIIKYPLVKKLATEFYDEPCIFEPKRQLELIGISDTYKGITSIDAFLEAFREAIGPFCKNHWSLKPWTGCDESITPVEKAAIKQVKENLDVLFSTLSSFIAIKQLPCIQPYTQATKTILVLPDTISCFVSSKK